MVGTRGRLLLVTLGLFAFVDLLVGIYLEHELRQSLEAGMWSELEHHAEASRAMLELSGATGIEDADRVANRAGAATSARITIVDREGRVVGDSEFSVSELATLELHDERPEVLDAFAHRVGRSTRLSTSLGEQMLYVAVLVREQPERWVVRAALPLGRVHAIVGRMRSAIILAGLISMVIAGSLTLLVSKLVSTTLRSVMSTAHAVAGPRSRAVEDGSGTGGSSRSLSHMAAELEQALGLLAAERNRFEAVLQTMDQAVLSLDARQRVRTVNPAARTLLHLRQDVEGQTLLEAVRIPALKELVEKAEVGISKSTEFEISGTGRQVEARVTMQGNGGLVVVIIDVTDIRRLERIRRDFVANVSHELRTPISVIRANTETLLSGAMDEPDQARPFIEAVLRHAERLGRLVSDLLDISRIEAGRYPLMPTRLYVADTVDHVFDSVEVEATAKDVDLEVEIDAELTISADRKALEQILINLVGNAVKYTGEHGHVTVTARIVEDEMRFEVIDDGQGIDPSHRERIFERFYRVDPGRSRDMGGTGLGLSIVKHLVEAMGGLVGVESRSPHGSIFWFTVPLQPVARSATSSGIRATISAGM